MGRRSRTLPVTYRDFFGLNNHWPEQLISRLVDLLTPWMKPWIKKSGGVSGKVTLLCNETTEPQSSFLHTAAADVRFQADNWSSTGFQSSSCFFSRMPAQRLAPRTNLTSSPSGATEQRHKNNLFIYESKWDTTKIVVAITGL